MIDLFPTIATSQSNIDIQALINKIDRLQRAVTDLERHYIKGGNRPNRVDNLKTQSTINNGSKSSARNTVRISQFESELRQIRGLVETVDFRLQKMEERFQKMEGRLNELVSAVDQRLEILEVQSKRLMTSRTLGVNGESLPPGNSVGGNNIDLRRPNSSRIPGVLGTIPKKLAVTKAQGPIKPGTVSVKKEVIVKAPVLPAGTPKFQYDHIYKILRQQDFPRAATALRAFIDLHPKNALTSNAYFWLGQIYYVQKDYRDAALLFAEGFQKFPQGNKGPDSLLKLGTSLMNLNKNVEACTAFARFFEDFPKARSDLTNRVKRGQRKALCR
ncbi:MAG: tol-pal system protein YbgF [Pseudomonadota bacterium]|nr:tol-pal system protein YbgF [Pseudomonadota bacterium]